MNDPDAPVLHLVYEEIDRGIRSRLWVYDSNKDLVGQLYTTAVRYEKEARNRGVIWVGFPTDGDNTLATEDFKGLA